MELGLIEGIPYGTYGISEKQNLINIKSGNIEAKQLIYQEN